MNTTQIYLHATRELKEQALAKAEPLCGRARRYRPPAQRLALLQALEPIFHIPSRFVGRTAPIVAVSIHVG